MMRRKLLYRRDFCGIIVWRFEGPPKSPCPTRAGGCLLLSIIERCCGDEPYFNCRKSLGAAHWVAQCWRWKTVRSRVSDGLFTPRITQNLMASLISLSLYVERRNILNGLTWEDGNLHSSTQSSFGPLCFGSEWCALTRSQHSSKCCLAGRHWGEFSHSEYHMYSQFPCLLRVWECVVARGRDRQPSYWGHSGEFQI